MGVADPDVGLSSVMHLKHTRKVKYALVLIKLCCHFGEAGVDQR